MKLFPAIDIKDKQVVRLKYGDYDRMTVYSADPVSVAQDFLNKGADSLHIVDLDGAKDGVMSNFDTVKSLLGVKGLFPEIGGGIRTEDAIAKYIEAGVGRVILGTIAVENPEFLAEMVKKYSKQIAVGIDSKDGFVRTRGWLENSGISTMDFCMRMRDMGVGAIICTDISKDGALSGTNMELYQKLSELEGIDVVASGGITYYDEIQALAKMNISGAILGKALYTGAIDLEKALMIVKE
jgi:phosphoribosylformimino-5-aminoimidazole carboxamide ribotide isomerase